MFKVTIRSALTMEILWVRFFSDENQAEKCACNWYDPEGKRGGKCMTSTWEAV